PGSPEDCKHENGSLVTRRSVFRSAREDTRPTPRILTPIGPDWMTALHPADLERCGNVPGRRVDAASRSVTEDREVRTGAVGDHGARGVEVGQEAVHGAVGVESEEARHTGRSDGIAETCTLRPER